MGGLRFVGSEVHWGDSNCASCGGRGWVTATENDGFVECAKVGNCGICAIPRSTSEEALLEERLAFLTHFASEDLMRDLQMPEDTVVH